MRIPPGLKWGTVPLPHIFTFTFTFSHLADAFIQSDLHMCELQCIHILHFTLMAHCTSGVIRGSVSCSRTSRDSTHDDKQRLNTRGQAETQHTRTSRDSTHEDKQRLNNTGGQSETLGGELQMHIFN